MLRGAWLVFFYAPFICWALRIKITPNNNIAVFPLEGDIPVEFIPERGDPKKVKIWLYQPVTHELTSIWDDIEPATSIYSLFVIPYRVVPGPRYVLRITTTDNKLLVDSTEFEISVKSENTSSYTTSSGPTSSHTSIASSPTDSTSGSTNTAPSSNLETISPTATNSMAGSAKTSAAGTSFGTTLKNAPIGAIIGGVLGGLALFTLSIGLIFCLRRRQHNDTGNTIQREEQWKEEPVPFRSARSDLVGGVGGAQRSPVVATVSPTLADSNVTTPSGISPRSGYTITASNSKGRSPTEDQDMSGSQPYSDAGHPRDNLGGSRSDGADMRHELEVLRTQVRLLEARQGMSWVHGGVPNEAPPDYFIARGGV